MVRKLPSSTLVRAERQNCAASASRTTSRARPLTAGLSSSARPRWIRVFITGYPTSGDWSEIETPPTPLDTVPGLLLGSYQRPSADQREDCRQCLCLSSAFDGSRQKVTHRGGKLRLHDQIGG